MYSMKIIPIVILMSFLFYYRSCSQDSPLSTDIWLLQLKGNTSTSYKVSNYKKITDNPGYDNQPFFVPSLNSILYVSDNNSTQTDIYQFDLATAVSKRVLKTEYYKEYSPMISYDGKFISCINIEPDGTSQRFWQFPFSAGIGKPLFPDITDVGYYCWLDQESVSFIQIGHSEDTNFSISIANISTGTLQKLDDQVGRCIQKARNKDILYYVKKYDSTDWKIRFYDFERNVYKGEIQLPEGQEDFTVGPNDVIWLSNNGKIVEASLQSPEWKTVFDFSSTPFKNFYRLVYSPEFNILALVTYDGKKP